MIETIESRDIRGFSPHQLHALQRVRRAEHSAHLTQSLLEEVEGPMWFALVVHEKKVEQLEADVDPSNEMDPVGQRRAHESGEFEGEDGSNEECPVILSVEDLSGLGVDLAVGGEDWPAEAVAAIAHVS